MKISSKGIKVLIFSDPHVDWMGANSIIEKESADKVICLGDYFDSHIIESVEENRKMAIWLKEQLNNNPNFVGLQGNHDNSYRYTHRFLKCSGYSESKDSAINAILKPEDWSKLLYCVKVDDCLLTHAGLHHTLIPKELSNVNEIYNWLLKEVESAEKALANAKSHWIYQVGRCRGGWEDVGGIFWQDVNREFIGSKIKQIFGHTYQRSNTIKVIDNSYCIDTHLNNWITITDGKLEIKSKLDW